MMFIFFYLLAILLTMAAFIGLTRQIYKLERAVQREQRRSIRWQRQVDEVVKESLTKAAAEQKVKYDKMIQNITELYKKEAKQQLRQLRRRLTAKTADLEKELARTLKTELAEVKAAVKEYKANELAEAEEKVAVMIKEAAYTALGRSLSLKDQQQLIIQALEEAKKKHVV